MSQAKQGDKVKIHFTGKTTSGDVFSTTQGHEPLEFTIGDGIILPGVEDAVKGMDKGERKTVSLTPEQGFGTRLDELILVVDRSQFPQDFEPEEGMELQVPQPDGSLVFFKVIEVGNHEVKLDANHPLAGFPLVFDIQLLEIA